MLICDFTYLLSSHNVSHTHHVPPEHFDIPPKPAELKSVKEEPTNARYRQDSNSKYVTGASFYEGVQHIRWKRPATENPNEEHGDLPRSNGENDQRLGA